MNLDGFNLSRFYQGNYSSRNKTNRWELYRGVVLGVRYLKIWRDNDFSDLNMYYELVNKATFKKFSNSEKEYKERKHQNDLNKRLMKEADEDFDIFGIEFQSIAEMNYSKDDIDIEINKKGNIRK